MGVHLYSLLCNHSDQSSTKGDLCAECDAHANKHNHTLVCPTDGGCQLTLVDMPCHLQPSSRQSAQKDLLYVFQHIYVTFW